MKSNEFEEALAHLISEGYTQRELEQMTIADIILLYKEGREWIRN